MTDRPLTHRTLGRYQLLIEVARGGMGQVWLGRLRGARGFNKLVAVKTLLPGEADRKRLEGLLQEEARIASLVHHSNVVHTLELGEHEGLLYLVMEWVDGEPLGFLLDRADERGGMPLGVAARLVSQVLTGLHAAHELTHETAPRGVVHRDVSPHNILVTYEGVAKLLDFGFARATEHASAQAMAGDLQGKLAHMAPEQILGGEVDRRCDIFATGIVLYLLSTGRHPFKQLNTAGIIHAITTDEPVTPPSTFISDYPVELEQVLLKALEKDPEKRWPTADAMRTELERALPEAFSEQGRAELLEFMAKVLGDRKAARHEAIRRAQLAADAHDAEAARPSGKRPNASAASLRAIAISQPPVGGSTRPSRAATPRARAKARTPLAPWLTAAAGVSLALAVILPRFLGPERNPAAAGAPSGATLPSATAPAAGMPSASASVGPRLRPEGSGGGGGAHREQNAERKLGE
jgi:hypothetical protein